MNTMPSRAYRRRLSRQNNCLFSFSADDGDVLVSRSGQVGSYARPSGDSVVTSTGTPNVAYGQPRWLDTPLGASPYMKPSDDDWSFPFFALLQPMSIYVAGYIEQGGSGSTDCYILRVGNGGTSTFDIITQQPSNNTVGQYRDGSGNPSVTLSSGNPASGDYVEYLLGIDASFKLTLSRSVNLGAPVVSSLSSAGAAFSGGFAGSVIKIANTTAATRFAYRQIVIIAET